MPSYISDQHCHAVADAVNGSGKVAPLALSRVLSAPQFAARGFSERRFSVRRFSSLRIALTVFFVILFAVMLPGELTAQERAAGARKVIVCSTTQVADFARQVVGDRWEVRCVLGPGEDPHTYSTGVDDLNSVNEADLCLENGWHLEGNEWMKSLAEQAGKPLVTCIEGVEGIDIDEDGEIVKDPHAWFNPRNAWIYTKNIRDAVVELDPENEEEYMARAALYQAQLRLLDGWIKSQLNQIDVRLLVTHHDAFGYFCEQYDFKPMSPVGWNTGDMAGLSSDARQEIVEGIRELGVKALFVESSVNSKTLDEIARDAGVEIGGTLYSDAMGPAGTAGETYLGMMRENVLTIVNALK